MTRTEQIEAKARELQDMCYRRSTDPHIERLANQLEKLFALPPDHGEAVPVVMECAKTAPERIWLQISDDPDHCNEPFPTNHEDITWCQDSVMDCQVEYVRADLSAPRVDAQEGEPVCLICGSTRIEFDSGGVPQKPEGHAQETERLRAALAEKEPST